MENTDQDFSHIPGWGVDADPKNDPTYPIKHRTNGEHRGYTWQRPTQQLSKVEILHSNERPSVSSVFGTSTPPSGLSGMIRRFAFGYSESSYGHWLPLALADRVNMVEGVLGDISQGHFPNIISELGWKVEWKHNRKSLITRIIVYILLAGAAITALQRSSSDDD